MSFDNFLNQTCTITRPQQIGLDRYRNADTLPVVVASDVRCRKTQKTMRILDPATNEYGFVHADLVLFAAGRDVRPGDLLTIGSQVWQVIQVLARQDMSAQRHVSCMVEAVNAQANA